VTAIRTTAVVIAAAEFGPGFVEAIRTTAVVIAAAESSWDLVEAMRTAGVVIAAAEFGPGLCGSDENVGCRDRCRKVMRRG
jgi:hypothetical protein